MTQNDVYEVLEKAKKPLCAIEISDILKKKGIDNSTNCVRHCLKKLKDYNEVKCVELYHKQAEELFNYQSPSKHNKKIYFYFV